MPSIDFVRELNPEQLAAVSAPDGPALVLAAAGTGKTRTLVYRVAHLVERGVRSDRILLLTFTNRAAREMLERADRLVRGVSGIWGGTFHHMANRLLRRHAPLVGYGNTYTILDRDDSTTLLRQAMQDLKLRGKEFPKPAVLLSLLCTACNSGSALETVVADWFAGVGAIVPAEPADVVRVLLAYEKRKHELNAMDFDDLLVNGLKLFREHKSITERYSEQFQHVLVDEYQDTNPLQAEWVHLVASLHRNLLVVGDDFQSIYSWRGADFRNIMTFRERYPDAGLYLLETNYRSVPEILAVANACIAESRHQYPKTLRATREPYHRPMVARLRDGAEQAQFVVSQLQKYRREGYKLSQMAVLYRAHFHAMELQMALTRAQTPYTITSGVRFFEQAHIKDVCSFLRVLASAQDELAFARLLELLGGVGPRTTARIWRKLGGACDLFEPLQRAAIADLLPAGARPGWANIGAAVPDRPAAPEAIIASRAVTAFLSAFYETYAAETFENAQRRIEDLQQMAAFTERFATLQEFLSDVSLLTNLDAEQEELGDAELNSVRLSTVHQAKGLEWRVVFVLWATDGMFPSSRSMTESDDGADEERRLFYVAVTRAQDELVLCVPQVRHMPDGGVIYCEPSRFVAELDPALIRDVLM